MPLIKRTVSPVNIALTKVVDNTRNELEYVTNSSLASIIRQLSSLSKHAEDMFSELVHDATIVFDRANNLQERVGRLKVKVTQLDSTVEEVSLQDINLRKPFKSSLAKDQQVIDLRSRPAAIDIIYKEQCEPPPPLSKLNPYREDGKESLKFYTDPQYFIELWYTKMQMDAEQQKRRKKTHSPHDEVDKNAKSRGQSMLRQGVKVREPANKLDKQQHAKHGPELANYSSRQQQQQHGGGDTNHHHQQQQHSQGHLGNGEWQGQQTAATRQQAQTARASAADGGPPAAQAAAAAAAAQTAGQRASAMAQAPASQQGGPMKRSTSSDSYGTYPAAVVQQQQYQQQPASVQHQMSASTYNYVGQYVMQQQQLQQEMMQQQGQGQYNAAAAPDAYNQQQKPQSPVKRSSGEAVPNSGHPGQGHAAIPEHLQHGSLVGVQMRFGSDSHESLPPPPPPPQDDNGGFADAAPARNSKTNLRSPPAVHKKPTSIRQSSPQQFTGYNQAPQQNDLSSSPRHFDGGGFDSLPPPPHMFHDGTVASSPAGTNQQFHLPPITPPPPMEDDDLLPTPPPMPLIQSPTLLNHDLVKNGMNGSGGGVGIPAPPEPPVYAQPDFNSYPSASSLGNVEAKEDSGGSADAEMDTRSDLLAAIRKGLQLRKVEEQRVKKEQQKMPPPSAAGGNARLDVQAIMEAAFEARRQMLEDSDSDFDDADENGDWSD